jgi:endonuclease YncB( thermonuclease family)
LSVNQCQNALKLRLPLDKNPVSVFLEIRMTSHRFFVGAAITSFVFLWQFDAGRSTNDPAQAAEQKSSPHPSEAPRAAVHSQSGFNNTGRAGTVRSGVKTGGNAKAQSATMPAHLTTAVLKGQVQATSSKVQQQLQASGTTQQHHRDHHHWHWGEYGYLPTSTSSLVVGVPSGNTLAVVMGGTVVPSIGTSGVAGRMNRLASGNFAPAVRLNGANAALSSGLSGSMVNTGGLVQTVRLAGVASPVAGQPFAAESQQHLSALANGRHVRIFQTGMDRHGAIVAQVFLANSGVNLNERQLRDGMAFNSVNDGFAPSLAAAEEAALSARTGLWNAKHPIPPWLVSP